MKRITRIMALALAAGLVLTGCEAAGPSAEATAKPARKPRVFPGDNLRSLPPSIAKLMGPENPEFAKAMTRMADRNKAQGRYDLAEQWYQRALMTIEKAPEPALHDLAATLENYADLLRKTGRADEAAELEARAKAIRAEHAEGEGEGAAQ